MKGVSQFLEVTLIIVITVVVSLIVANFVMNTATQRTQTVENATRQKLNCQFGDMFIRNVTFDCNNNCFLGNPYLINASIENSGTIALDFDKISTRLTTGEEYTMYAVKDSISAASIETHNFNSILMSSNPVMPTETMHTHRAYSNDSNTVALWHFDEGSGNSAADSGRNNTGSIINRTSANEMWNTSANCKFNACLTFNGINQTVRVGYNNNSNITGDKLTLEAWVNTKTVSLGTTFLTVISKMNSTGSEVYSLRIIDPGRIRFQINNGSVRTATTSDVIASNAWYHLAGVYNGSNMKIFINGVESTSSNVEGNIASTSNDIYIGSNNSVGWFFNGSIDEPRISNFARSFNTTLNYTVNYQNLQTVALYNGTGAQIVSASASGSGYSNTVLVNTSDEYRVQVTDTSGNIIEKWYPVKPGANLCVARNKLEKVVLVAQNCPELFDALPGNLVNFVRCG